MERNAPPTAALALRRGSSRLRTNLPARLIDVTASHDVRLENLSRTGARIELQDAPRLCRGESMLLQWAGFEHFGEIVWRKGNHAGITFDEEASERELLETRHLQDHVQRDGCETFLRRKAAREWASGLHGTGR